MNKYNIADFVKGLPVYHKSNTQLKMIVIGTTADSSEVICRWMDKEGKSHKEEFFFEELMKCSDKVTPRIF